MKKKWELQLIKLTERVYHTSQAVGIKLLDHIIVAGDRCYSFMEKVFCQSRG
jgi:DNA repair protein RadC